MSRPLPAGANRPNPLATARSTPSDGLFSRVRSASPGLRASSVDEPPPSRFSAWYAPKSATILAHRVRVTPALLTCLPSTVSRYIVFPSRENPTALRAASAVSSNACGAPSLTSSTLPPTAANRGPPSEARGRYATSTRSPTFKAPSASAPASRPSRTVVPAGMAPSPAPARTPVTTPPVSTTSVTRAAPSTARCRG